LHKICITSLVVVRSLHLPKILEFYLCIQMLPAKCKWLHFSWATLYSSHGLITAVIAIQLYNELQIIQVTVTGLFDICCYISLLLLHCLEKQCWLGNRKIIQPVKSWVCLYVKCMH